MIVRIYVVADIRSLTLIYYNTVLYRATSHAMPTDTHTNVCLWALAWVSSPQSIILHLSASSILSPASMPHTFKSSLSIAFVETPTLFLFPGVKVVMGKMENVMVIITKKKTGQSGISKTRREVN